MSDRPPFIEDLLDCHRRASDIGDLVDDIARAARDGDLQHHQVLVDRLRNWLGLRT